MLLFRRFCLSLSLFSALRFIVCWLCALLVTSSCFNVQTLSPYFPFHRPIQWRDVWAYFFFRETTLSFQVYPVTFYSTIPSAACHCFPCIVLEGYLTQGNVSNIATILSLLQPVLLIPLLFRPPCGFCKVSGYFPGASRLVYFFVHVVSLFRRYAVPVFYYSLFKEPFLHPFFALCKIWISKFWTSKRPKKRMVNHTIS